MPLCPQVGGDTLPSRVAPLRDRIERRMRLSVQIREIPDEIRQQFHVACLDLVAADEAQFTGPVKPNFLRARQHVPGAVPRAALTGVEPVARGSRVGEGRIDMALTVEGQVMRPPREGQFSTVERGTALRFGDQAGTGLAFDLGENRGLLVAVDQPPQHWGLVMGLGNQPDKSTVIDRRDPQTPPRSASTYPRTRRILGNPPAIIASTGRTPSNSGPRFGSFTQPREIGSLK